MTNKPNNEQALNRQELTPEEMEDVTGGGVREIVASVTLAAMAMTGSTASAFALGRAMAEGNGAFVDTAPDLEQRAWAGDAADITADSAQAEAAVSEVAFDLGGGALAANSFEESTVAAEAIVPAAPTFEVGARRIFKLDALARACGIEGQVEGVGVIDEADSEKYRLFTDEDGDPAIEFIQSFDAMTLGFFVGDEIPTATLVHAVVEDATAPAVAEAPATNEAADEDDALIVEAADEAAEDDAVIPEDDEAADEQTGAPADEESEPAEAGEAGIDLMELAQADGDLSLAANEEAAVANSEMMANLIDAAVEARQDEGISAALDCTFETLADNAESLANPETGVVEADGNEIVNLTYDALASRFDNTPEELMGAIGAAAMRADERGDLEALGNSRTLVSLASTSATEKKIGQANKHLVKASIEGAIDQFTMANPMCRFLGAPMKALVGEIFGLDSSDPNRAILQRLDELEDRIDEMEQTLMSHTTNVVALDSLGGEFQALRDAIRPLSNKIGDITGNPNLSQDEKNQRLSELYNSSEYSKLTDALSGATNAYGGNTRFDLNGTTIFTAAYNMACEQVMFSGEAVDLTMPYMMRLLADYLEGYGLVSQVLEAYEAEFGPNAALASRETMYRDLGGVVDGEKSNKVSGVFEQYRDFRRTNHYIFVDKGRCNIQVSNRLVVKMDFVKHNTTKACSETVYTPDIMKNNPLSPDQVKHLAKYCADKKTSLYNYLVNDLDFYIFAESNAEIAEKSKKAPNGIYITGPYGVGNEPLYMATGAQNIKRQHKSGGYSNQDTLHANVINFRKVGATDETIKLSKSSSSSGNSYEHYNLIFFQEW